MTATHLDLSVPIWTIEHVAAAFHVSVDTAREHTYRHDFPAPRAGFGRNLWRREEVLAWFAALPGVRREDGRTARTRASGAGTGARRPGNATRPGAVPIPARAPGDLSPADRPKSYRKRRAA